MKDQEEEITYCNIGTTENPKIIKLSKVIAMQNKRAGMSVS
jgi:hypothetical protein